MGNWNDKNPSTPIHLQPIPEGQSSEEVILAAVVGKTTPDIYGNMWQGNVEMYARSKCACSAGYAGRFFRIYL